MSKAIKIGEIEATRGTKKSGFLRVHEGPISPVDMPITIINGRDDGPTLCLTAGTHGCEFTGIAAVTRIIAETRPEELKGALIAIPVINMRSFEGRIPYVNPIDNVNIEKAYPGNPHGSSSERIASYILEEVVRKADYAVDCHAGDVDEIMLNHVWFSKVGNREVDTKTEAIARIFGLEYFCQKIEPGRMMESAKRGVAAIQVECGSLGVLSKRDLADYHGGLMNVMKYLGMINGKPKITVKQKTAVGVFRVYAETGGFFFPSVELKEDVSKEQIVGEIKNIVGETTSRIHSPETGMIRKLFTQYAVAAGRWVMDGFPSPKPAPPFSLTDQYVEAINM